jgi:hypothetical protein
MKLTLNKLYLIIIGVLILIIILLRSCSPNNVGGDCQPITKTVIKTDTIWKVTKGDTLYVPGVTKYLPGKIQYINSKIDTTEIIKDFFSKVYYGDTIKLDNYGFILVKDTITQNRILSRNIEYNYKFPTIEKTITNNITSPPKNQFYIGLELGGSKLQPINYLGANLLLKTKKDKLYNIGAGVMPNTGIEYKIGTAWKIKIKK